MGRSKGNVKGSMKPMRGHEMSDSGRESTHAGLRRAERQKQQSMRRLRLPVEELSSPEPRRAYASSQGFKCGHCKQFIGLLPSGGHHRNHCPACLYSRHVDGQRSGDRASTCGALMEPIGAFVRPKNGEHVLVHRCLGCGFERFNRIAADDDFDLVLALPQLPPRSAHPGDGAL